MESKSKKNKEAAKELARQKRENKERIKEVMKLKKELELTKEERDQLSYQLQDAKQGKKQNMNNSYSTSGNDQFYKQQINQKDSKIGEQTKIIQDLQKKL